VHVIYTLLTVFPLARVRLLPINSSTAHIWAFVYYPLSKLVRYIHPMKLNRSKKGFTLVEIMIVVVIIGLLAAMAIPAFQKVRRNSIAKTMQNDARQVASGIQQILTQFPTLGLQFNVTYNNSTGLLNSTADATIGLNADEIQNYVKTISRGYGITAINYNGEAAAGTAAFTIRHPQVAPKDVLPTTTSTTLNAVINFDSDGKVID
jgi:type IV pilus assembly protein PilA